MTLASKIRLVDICQVARAWWTDTRSGTDCARERLLLLVREGLLERLTVREHRQLERVWSWHPHEHAPSFDALSYRLRSRWTEPLRPTTVYVASSKSARRYAGTGGRLSHPLQATHDLHVAAIYFRLLRENPEEAEGWVSEDVLAASRRGQKIPDAEIHDAQGRPLKVIEFGGGYPPERVQKVHEDCVRRQLPYELW